MKRGFAALALLGALGACGSDPAPSPQPTPTSYAITAQDLRGSEVRDICRARDAAFLNTLVLRVAALLPPGSASFAFDTFDVEKGDAGKQAVIRFRAALPGGEVQGFTASGNFDAPTCHVGPLSAGPVGGAADAYREAGAPVS